MVYHGKFGAGRVRVRGPDWAREPRSRSGSASREGSPCARRPGSSSRPRPRRDGWPTAVSRRSVAARMRRGAGWRVGEATPPVPQRAWSSATPCRSLPLRRCRRTAPAPRGAGPDGCGARSIRRRLVQRCGVGGGAAGRGGGGRRPRRAEARSAAPRGGGECARGSGSTSDSPGWNGFPVGAVRPRPGARQLPPSCIPGCQRFAFARVDRRAPAATAAALCRRQRSGGEGGASSEPADQANQRPEERQVEQRGEDQRRGVEVDPLRDPRHSQQVR